LHHERALATEGLVQHRFCASGADVLNSTAVILIGFCAELKLSVSKSPPAQSRLTLGAIIKNKGI
jgi:hypothetical protein